MVTGVQLQVTVHLLSHRNLHVLRLELSSSDAGEDSAAASSHFFGCLLSCTFSELNFFANQFYISRHRKSWDYTAIYLHLFM